MKVSLSKRARWVLVQLFYDVVLPKDRTEMLAWTRSYNRARLALGLAAPMAVLSAGRKVDPAILTDDPIVHDLEKEVVDFMLEQVVIALRQPIQIVTLGDLFEALSSRTETQVEGIPYDPKAEVWGLPEDAMARAAAGLAEIAEATSRTEEDTQLALQAALAERKLARILRTAEPPATP